METKTHPSIVAAWFAIIAALITALATLAVPFIAHELESKPIPIQVDTTLSGTQPPTPTETLLPETSSARSLTSIVAEYIVDNGDSLPIVSRNIFGVDAYSVAIGKANCTSVLHTGDKLTIYYYIVQEGDYLYLIATHFGTSVDRLQDINGFWDEIYPNQIVVLPTYEQCK
jgi:LysM repeat protein